MPSASSLRLSGKGNHVSTTIPPSPPKRAERARKRRFNGLQAIALALLLILTSAPAFAVSNPAEMLPDPAQEARARDIGHQLRCMVCQNESVEESEADLARDFRRIIRDRVRTGESDQQIMDWMVARYGNFIRLRPPFSALTVLLWGAPLVAVGIGAGAVLLGRRRRPVPPAPLSEAERQRLVKLSGS
jgi:cytochrome c-type biogenesis protein CcmH